MIFKLKVNSFFKYEKFNPCLMRLLFHHKSKTPQMIILHALGEVIKEQLMVFVINKFHL